MNKNEEIQNLKKRLEELEKESLLEEAKRRYPIGTKVRCLIDDCEYKVESPPRYGSFGKDIIWIDSNRAACIYNNGEWAEIIEGFKDGDWVYWEGHNPTVARIDGDVRTDGFNKDCYRLKEHYKEHETWFRNGYYTSCHKNYLSPATEDQIKDHLVKESERRGLKEGATYATVEMNLTKKITGDITYKEHWHNKDFVLLDYGNSIYIDGRWAEIVGLTINGYKMEIDGDYVKFGCAMFLKNDINRLHSTVDEFNTHLFKENRKITSFKLDSGVEITVEQLKSIVDVLNS